METIKKPENLSVMQWINHVNNFNSYLPLVANNAVRHTDYDLASKVIAQNVPQKWENPFHLMELHLKETVEEILDKLLIIKDQ